MPEAEIPHSAVPPFERTPRHVAIIMDGNGRWAAARGLPRVEGHRRGVEALRRNDLAELHRSGVRVRVIGERVQLDPEIGRLLVEAEELTKSNDGLTLVVAFNYGARQEITRAAQRIAEKVAKGSLTAAEITMETVSECLDAPDIPDPDLIIRTSGEQRLSNFLLWQSAYSELVFVPTYWPDFDRAALETAIREYQQRERRFGGLAAKTGS
jgi:undecaprenyl diphosphate synthase